MSKSYNLFLDDIRIPKGVTWVDLPLVEWTIVRNYKQFVNCVNNNGVPAFVAYDHDLADSHYTSMNSGDSIDYNSLQEKTGYDCAKYLCEQCRKLNVPHPPFVVHSMNIVGGDNIRKYIAAYNRTVTK